MMKRFVGSAVGILALLLSGCGGGDEPALGGQASASPDAGACTTLAKAWTDFVTGDDIMSLNGEDLTATRWQEIYSGGKELLANQGSAVGGLADPDVKAAWGEWESAGDAAITGLEGGDSMAEARMNIAEWANSGKAAMAECGLPTDSLPALSSSAPSIGG